MGSYAEINKCYVYQSGFSNKLNLNRTHIISNACTGEQCNRDCVELAIPFPLDRCTIYEPNQIVKMTRGPYVPNGKYLYGRIYSARNLCESNTDIPFVSIISNVCINDNSVFQKFKMIKRDDKSFKVEYDSRINKATARSYVNKDCNGSSTVYTVDLNKCDEYNQTSIFIKITSKP